MAPAVGGMTLETAYAGLRPATPDHRPIIGPAPGVAGLLYATGHYGSGILLAPITAQAIAALVVDGRKALPLAGLSHGGLGRRGRRWHGPRRGWVSWMQ